MPTLYISDKYKWSYNNFDARRYDFYEFVDVTRFGSELKKWDPLPRPKEVYDYCNRHSKIDIGHSWLLPFVLLKQHRLGSVLLSGIQLDNQMYLFNAKRKRKLDQMQNKTGFQKINTNCEETKSSILCQSHFSIATCLPKTGTRILNSRHSLCL